MRILGFDPGYERIGWGVIDREGSRLRPVAWGLITTPRISTPDRLLLIGQAAEALLAEHRPDALAVEKLFFAKNQTTVMDVARASGVLLYCGAAAGLTAAEYSPPEVKQSVVGNGRAEKKQIEFMVVKLLGLAEPPRPDDVADALAVAITHALRLPPSR